MSSSIAHSLRIAIHNSYRIPRKLDHIPIEVLFVFVKLLLLKKLNKIVLIKINMHLPFNIVYPFINKKNSTGNKIIYFPYYYDKVNSQIIDYSACTL